MAIRPFNSIAGISVGLNSTDVILANGDIQTTNLTANGIVNFSTTSNVALGTIANVHILGGTIGQVISTDGTGNLTFSDQSAANSVAPMPYYIPVGESYLLPEDFQGLFTVPIEIDGVFEIDGILAELGTAINSVSGQVIYDDNGDLSGNVGFTFNQTTGNFAVPGSGTFAGALLPSANITYDLGSSVKRWNDLYLSGTTIYIGNSTIATNGSNLILTNPLGGTFVVAGSGSATSNSISNGNSNVFVNATSVTIGANGNANVMAVYGFGANITGTLSTTGNASVSGILTNNYYYANGSPLDIGGQPAGSNTQLQFNDTNEFGASANLSFNNVTNNLAVAGNIVVSTGQYYGDGAGLSNIAGANVTGTVANAANSTTAGTVITNAQPNITSVGTLTDLSVSGNGTIGGNLIVNGNLVYVNVEELAIKDPIINLNTGANGTPPASNTGKDVGTALNYYNTQARVAFMGWDTSNAEFAFGSQTSITSEIVTFTTLGNVRAQIFKGNVEATTISGNLTTASQANITTVGTLGSLSVTGNINSDNTISANYLVSTAGCVSIGGGTIAVSGTTGGVFNASISDINIGLAANVVMGSVSSLITIQGNLTSNHNISATGNVTGNLLTGTITTNAQPNITSVGILGNLSVTGNINTGNITVTNTVDAVNIKVTDLYSKRAAVPISASTLIDSFPTTQFRSAKYTMRAGSDTGYQALEVLLVHNDINSIITVYGSLSTTNTDLVTFDTDISSGNVNVYANAIGANTNLNLMGTYVPD
jgi:hypothetical protein